MRVKCLAQGSNGNFRGSVLTYQFKVKQTTRPAASISSAMLFTKTPRSIQALCLEIRT